MGFGMTIPAVKAAWNTPVWLTRRVISRISTGATRFDLKNCISSYSKNDFLFILIFFSLSLFSLLISVFFSNWSLSIFEISLFTMKNWMLAFDLLQEKFLFALIRIFLSRPLYLKMDDRRRRLTVFFIPHVLYPKLPLISVYKYGHLCLSSVSVNVGGLLPVSLKYLSFLTTQRKLISTILTTLL